MTELRSELRLSPRERMVLTAIIEMYIATGEPVASQALARTFRGPRGIELGHAAQRDGGSGRQRTAGAGTYLGGAHSDGGGVPLLRGADYAIGPACIGAKDREQRSAGAADVERCARGDRLKKRLTGVTSSHEYLERTSHLLALISSGLGVALASATEGQVLEHIHFSRLSTGRVLAVLVTQSGAVQDRVLVLDHELTHLELETAARYLNENFRGWPVERIQGGGGAARGCGTRGVSADAVVCGRAMPQRCAGRWRTRPGHFCGRHRQPDRHRT